MIKVIQKPKEVPYTVIHDVLWAAHEENRKNGLYIKSADFSPEEIEQHIGKDGVCFVALDDDDRVVGTSSVRAVTRKKWYARGRVFVDVLDGVLPKYQGQHIKSMLDQAIEEYARSQGIKVIEFRTAEANTARQQIGLHEGYRMVDFFAGRGLDHYTVVMVKHLKGWRLPKPLTDILFAAKKASVKLTFRPGHRLRVNPVDRIKRIPVCARVLSFAAYAAGKYSTKEAKEAIRDFVPDAGPAEKKKLLRDIKYCRVRYSMSPAEYFLFRFPDRTPAQRELYVSHVERRKLTNALNSTNEAWKILKDKYASYETFREFYGRDAICVGGEKAGTDGSDAFYGFVKKHSRFIVKPLDATRGEGIYIADLTGKDPEEFFREKLAGKKSCVEELIRQAPEMGHFHPESVNTVRIVTWLDGDDAEIVFALVRMGCGGSVVDNAGAGGIIAAVDADTGVVRSAGLRESGSAVYETHPDTGAQIRGTRIPMWEELREIAARAAKTLPEQRWIGWDFALSKDGWVIVEANQSPSFVGIQMCMDRGVRDLVNRTIGDGVR